MIDPRIVQWVKDLVPACVGTAAKLKISPEALVAQAALETGWGKSKVGEFGLFGIKADPSWHGLRVLVRTWEVIGGQRVELDDWFRDYPSYQACIEDHFKFLDTNARYRAAGVFNGNGDEAYFRALQRAGYATDPNYADKLMLMLRDVRAAMGTAQPSIGPRDLAHGMTGPDVLALQKALLNHDSIFGVQTLRALKAFQASNGLQIDGVAGPATRAKLGI